MKITWFGHSCFRIELSNAVKIITDPYKPQAYSGAVKYMPIGESADIVTVSHHHADHDFTEGVPAKDVFDKEGIYTVGDIKIETVSSYHDDTGGSQRGGNIIFIINAEGMRLAHFGDLGTLDIDYDKLAGLDIVMVPVGGVFTIGYEGAAALLDKLQPKIFIPMHFKTHKIEFDIDGVDKFIKDRDNVEEKDVLDIDKYSLPASTKIVVLKHIR